MYYIMYMFGTEYRDGYRWAHSKVHKPWALVYLSGFLSWIISHVHPHFNLWVFKWTLDMI